MDKALIYDTSAKQVGELTLNKKVFAKEFNGVLVAQAIRVYLANQRKSQAKSKTRGEVSGTTKKMWAQKGTGNARHGSAKAPQFVGGGKAHGPTNLRNYSLSLNKKMRRLAINCVLSKFAKHNAILAIQKLSVLSPKTKAAFALLSDLRKLDENLLKSKKIGIVTTGQATSISRAFKNLPKVSILNTNSLNVYNLSNQDYLIFSKNALNRLNK